MILVYFIFSESNIKNKTDLVEVIGMESTWYMIIVTCVISTNYENCVEQACGIQLLYF